MDCDESSNCSYSTAYAEPPYEMRKALNQVEYREHERQNRTVTICDIFLKVLFVLLSIPWLISVIFYSIFDTKCILIEQASVINCSQGIYIANPKHWVFAWLIISTLSSVLFVSIIAMNEEKLNYQRGKLMKIHHKGSFCSLMFLLVGTSIFYFIRVISLRSDTTNLLMNILFFVWPSLIAVVVCCLNYLPRVHWKKTKKTCLPRGSLVRWQDCLIENSNFIIYWLALFVYFVEITCRLIASLLNAAEEVAPLVQSTYPEGFNQYRSVMMMVIGFKVAYHARLLSFFWQKCFNGNKDLLSEPGTELVG